MEAVQKKIDNLKELLGFQKMVKHLREVSSNRHESTANTDLDKYLTDYDIFEKSVFQTPSEFERLIRKTDRLLVHGV